MNAYILAVVGTVVIGSLLGLALFKGVNGTLLATGLSVISGIICYAVGKKAGKH